MRALLYLKRGSFADETALLNSAQPLVEPPVVAEEPVAAEQLPASYEGLSPRALILLAAAGILGFASLWMIKARSIGDFVRFPLDGSEAALRADEVLRQQGQIPASYHRAVSIQYTFDPLANEVTAHVVFRAGLSPPTA